MWEYNAPQYVDFTKRNDDDKADTYFDVDHEMELDNQLMHEQRIIKLLDDSTLSDVTCIGEDQESGCAVARNDASSTPAVTKVPAPVTPQSSTLSVRESQGSASISAYEDALAELSTTRTPVLPTLSKAVSLRRSARKAAQSNVSSLTASEENIPASLCSSLSKWKSMPMTNRELAVSQNDGYSAKDVCNEGIAASKQAVNHSAQRPMPVSVGKKCLADVNTLLHKSSNYVKTPCLRSRTRSLDQVKTSDVKREAATSLHSRVKRDETARAAGRSRSQSVERDQTAKSSSSASKRRPQIKLTIPRTPQLLKRELKFLHVVPVQSSEEQELSKIRELRRALADKRRLAEVSRIKTLAAPARSTAVRPPAPLTEPEGFHFVTDGRLKSHGMETRQDADQYKEMCFSSDLRHYAQLRTKPKGPTLPQPFHLTMERKRKLSEGDVTSSKFESIAEKVIKFSSKTPERFRRRPSPRADHALNHSHKPADSSGTNLTVPKTPNLETRRRLRPNTAISQSEREEAELQEAKKHQFRAKPVNPEIFANPTLGIKKVVPRECTVAAEFHLEIEDRLKQRHINDADDQSEEFEFHARPVPKAILEGPVVSTACFSGIQPAKAAPLTVPQSPMFAVKRVTRAAAAESIVKQQAESMQPLVKSRPVPHAGIPFQPRLDHHTTDVVPFSFDERDKEMFARKEEKKKTVLEQEKKAREFKANPMRDLTPVLPPKRTQPPTKPEPFDLEVDVRGAVKAEEFKKLQEEETLKLKSLASFKAQFPSILASKPYVPAKSNRPLTEIHDVQLNTDRRAESRLEWEKWKHERETDAAMERCAREKQRQDAEAAETARARADAVHKAQPVRRYRPVDIHPSSQILTLPESPKFSERLRLKTSHH